MRAVDPCHPALRDLDAAADVLRRGGVVAFPTETFYGLGASVLEAAAARRLVAMKARPADKPLLVVVDSIDMAETVAEITDSARELMRRFWPGALTIVLPVRAHVPTEVTAGSGTIGVRLPAHAVARGLPARLGAPVTAPSANRSGAAPPTTAADVLATFRGEIDMVLDGGTTAGGPPSTLVDVTAGTPRILRQGAVRL